MRSTSRQRSRQVTAAAKQHTSKAVKIAVDFPAQLLQETEKAGRDLSMNRSALIRTAVEAFLHDWQRQKLEERIARSFSVNADLDRQLIDDFKHVDDAEF